MKTISVAMLAGIVSAFVQPGSATAQSGTFKERVLHSFAGSPDGWGPEASLIDVKGILYGTSSGGGTEGVGTVFSIDPASGAEAVVYSFCSQQNCADGADPQAGLINVGGILYGTTYESNTNGGRGTVFSLDPSTGTEKVIYSFCSRQNCTDGSSPAAGLIDVKGRLYGTTAIGGAHNLGTVFAIDRNTGKEKVLHSFAGGTDGANPYAGLIDVGGVLYGTTANGGGCNFTGCGIVFSLNLDTGVESVVYAFAGGTDGQGPSASLIDVNGILYGTTAVGGGGDCTNYFGCGTVFSVDPGTGTETVLHAFAGPDGAIPDAGLIDVGGVLYGTTSQGGVARRDFGGTAFSVDPATGAETVLHTFCPGARTCPGDGFRPQAGLIDVHGTLYGTTYEGGAYGPGTVFSLKEKRR
ncbi:MAG TPA: choice-of-anchor tandem repeat GloVer-containing protein [Rhizomicrobium sp.]|nr:choice-of-anchor tandem repeat GloVer-containing protein [Rhizomicrobium sp.]